MDSANEKTKIFPWLGIMVKPRSTFRYVIEYTPVKYAGWLAVLFGFLSLFAPSTTDGGKMWGDLISALIFGSIMGLIIWWVSYKLNFHIGKWLGGTGSKEEMKIATGWAFIPSIIGLILINLPLNMIYGDITGFYGNSDYPLQMILLYIGDLIGIWSIIINILAIAEVHKLSIWRSIIVHIIPAVLLLIILVLFSLI
ncbi:YIP1 family protein [Chungangia koreensis]|uniref:YIP1 family protein n=1 Tax=Chungangia koreensis TaxID=752657 RepID=A0ABV8X8L7_9LACT